MEKKLRVIAAELALLLLAEVAALAPMTDDALATAYAEDCEIVLIVMPGFAEEREERNAEAEEGESVNVVLLKPVGAVAAILLPVREAETGAAVGEDKRLEVAVAFAPDSVELALEGGGRVTPGAKCALRVATGEVEAVKLGWRAEAVTVIVTVWTADPQAEGAAPTAMEVLEALAPALAPVSVLVELITGAGFALFEVPGGEVVEFELGSELVQLFESAAAKDATGDPEPVRPPETPVLLIRATASACVSQVIDVPTLFTSGRAKHWVPPAHVVVCHLPPTHCANEPSTQAISEP